MRALKCTFKALLQPIFIAFSLSLSMIEYFLPLRPCLTLFFLSVHFAFRYGFITFETEEEAKRVLRDGDNLVLKGRKLNVAIAIKKQQIGRIGEFTFFYSLLLLLPEFLFLLCHSLLLTVILCHLSNILYFFIRSCNDAFSLLASRLRLRLCLCNSVHAVTQI